MKNHQLIEAYGKNPFAKLMSSHYRSMEGILYHRKTNMSSGAKSTDGWLPLAVYDHNVCVRSNKFYRPATLGYMSEQAYWNMELFKESVRPSVTIPEFPASCILQPKLKRIPNRREMIREAINESVFPSVGFDAPIVEPMRKLMWEWMLTRAARKITTSRMEIERGMNEMVSSNSFQMMQSLFDQAKEQVMNINMDSAYDILNKIHSASTKYSEQCARIRNSVDAAKSNTKEAFLPLGLYFYKDGTVSKLRESSHAGTSRDINGYVAKKFIIKSNDLIEGWERFSEFLNRIGVEVPKPFGMEFNSENITKLSACWETAAETLADPTEYLKAECPELQDNAVETTTNKSSLFLG